MMAESRRETFCRGFAEGVERFNRHRFWDAHESWEELWLEADSHMHRFLQGLIQIAAAYHHIQRGTYSGATRLIDSGCEKLASFPPDYCGLDRQKVVSAAVDHGERLTATLNAGGDSPSSPLISTSEFPRLVLLRSWESQVSDHW